VWDIAYAEAQEVQMTQETQETQGAPSDAPAASQPPSFLGNPLFMIGAFLLIMYLFLLRPNQRREKERQAMLASLEKGDQVVTTGGICGTIAGVKDKTVVLRVDKDGNVKMEFLRGSISQVIAKAGSAEAESN